MITFFELHNVERVVSEPSDRRIFANVRARHLLLVDYLLRYRSLREAAKHMNLSQPAASMMLNQLEEWLGARLFERGKSGLVPIASIAPLIARFGTLLNEFDGLSDDVGRLAAGGRTILRIGCVPQAFFRLIPGVVVKLLETDPAVALKVTEGASESLLQQLVEGKLDCAIGRLPPDGLSAEIADQIVFFNLYEQELAYVGCKDHRLSGPAEITYQTLQSCQWALPSRPSATRKAFAEAFLRNGLIPPEPILETSTYLHNLAISSKTDILTIAPKEDCERNASLGLVSILNVRVGVTPMNVCALFRRTSDTSGAVDSLKAALRTAVGGLPGAS